MQARSPLASITNEAPAHPAEGFSSQPTRWKPAGPEPGRAVMAEAPGAGTLSIELPGSEDELGDRGSTMSDYVTTERVELEVSSAPARPSGGPGRPGVRHCRSRSVADGYAQQQLERLSLRRGFRAAEAAARRRTQEAEVAGPGGAAATLVARYRTDGVAQAEPLEGGDSMMQQLLWVMERLQDELAAEEDRKREALQAAERHRTAIGDLQGQLQQVLAEVELCTGRAEELSSQLGARLREREGADEAVASIDQATMSVQHQVELLHARSRAAAGPCAADTPLSRQYRSAHRRLEQLAELRTRRGRAALEAPVPAAAGLWGPADTADRRPPATGEHSEAPDGKGDGEGAGSQGAPPTLWKGLGLPWLRRQ
mmetsp:Transcript_10857/g.27464  ORF Transcript_10857/g.27464 Transcript_10857/m.27464 type:complete len:370 (+) Transcript_10857:606-1715(+)